MEVLGYAPPIAAASGTAARTAGSRDPAEATATDFEAFFLAQFLDGMFAGISTDGPFGGGQAEEVYRSLLTQELGRSLAKAGGFGIADVVRREIIRLQEAG
jgi:Rod binding domain-containing protein